ncbi:hypothetical protein [Sphingomonas sp. CLY1604]|uniref:hypothetical protein n=1 Tax=Sphingomonas sp. CLY1604 TaxID=3457786 RepID=UPI003FD882A5
MNDTTSAGGATGASLIPSTTDAFTAAHLAVVAIFAIVVIAAIIWGSRLKHRRKAAEREIAERNAEVEHGATAAPAGAVEDDAPRPVVREDAPVVPASRPVAVPPVEDTPPALAPLADEPIAATAPLDAAPATEAASTPAPAPAASSPADEPVSTLKGLGPKLATRLGELGITTVGQIAALNDDEAARLDAQLGPFAGRMARDRWIEQARFLAAGDRAGFEAVFGRL